MLIATLDALDIKLSVSAAGASSSSDKPDNIAKSTLPFCLQAWFHCMTLCRCGQMGSAIVPWLRSVLDGYLVTIAFATVLQQTPTFLPCNTKYIAYPPSCFSLGTSLTGGTHQKRGLCAGFSRSATISSILMLVCLMLELMTGGFPHLRALWGDQIEPILANLPRNTGLCPPTGPPWVGDIVDADTAQRLHRHQLEHEGKPLPAHEYSEYNSSGSSPWWLQPIKLLHDDARHKESHIKYQFSLQYPCRSPLHVNHHPEFLDNTLCLHSRLACIQAVFWIRTLLQGGITVSTASQVGASTAAATAAAVVLEYTQSVLDSDYLAAWLALPTAEVLLWGMEDYPHDPAPGTAVGPGTSTGV
ncbi:hypothetical protein DFH08DRAFT_978086 [Mycena albidolilacea]|uniref:Uncharacterized protein n=1 Tax=Mycena albidolilacea TaxID=1033008 RepID=A0AAD6YZH2_9AGAR|nr:hypothetical protein DFH08DRAFT_978086 [Mycena albidolilacea]